MKIKLFTLITFSLLLTSCDPLTTFSVFNNYPEPIYLASPEFNCVSLYPDTVLPKDIGLLSLLDGQEKIDYQETFVFWQGMTGPTEELFCYNDTMSFYIFNADTVDFYGWDTIVKYNMVLQRYDLSMQDYTELNTSMFMGEIVTLNFPPTDDMKHIHMWPPYGTYDEHGRRKNKH